MKYRSRITAAVTLAGSATCCLGQPTVTLTGGVGGSFVSPITLNGTFPGYDIHVRIVNPTGTVIVDVDSDDGNVISDLVIDFNNHNEDVDLYVHGDTRTDRCGNVRAIYLIDTGGTGDLTLSQLFSDGNVDSIRVNYIDDVDLEGNLGTVSTAGIFMEAPNSGDPEIDRIIVDGTMRGDIRGYPIGTVDIGLINEVAVNGDIGTSSDSVTIEANLINNITADNIYADITLDTTGTNGKVRRIETRSTYNFIGSLTMSEFHSSGGTGTPGLFIGGDLDADITITNDLNTIGQIDVSDDFAAGKIIDVEGDAVGDINFDGDMSGTINIDEGLAGDITMGASGLDGQIICNSADGNDSWSGDVTVGTTILSPTAAYTQTGLGGGAVGEVPFDCHLQDCDPPYSGSTSPILGDGITSVEFEVTLRHYGPVTWTSGMPIKVEYCPTAQCDGPTNVTSDFEVTHAAGSRDILVTVKSNSTAAVGYYHLSPFRTGDPALKCDETTANEPLVADYTYDVEYKG